MTYFLFSLLLFLIGPIIAMLWLKIPQFFNFINLYFLLQCFLILPAAIALVGGSTFLHEDVESVLQARLVESVANFLILYSIMNIFVLVGLVVTSPSPRILRNVHGVLERPQAPHLHMIFAWALTSLALVLFVWKVSQIGGLSFLLQNTSRRVELQSGLGPINFLQEGAFWVALLLSAKLAGVEGAKRTWIVSFVVILALACLSSTVFGGRKSAIQYILGSMMIIAFYRAGFSKMTLVNTMRLFLMSGGLFLYFFLVQVYRDTNDVNEFTAQLPDLLDTSVESASDVSMSLSYLDQYIFVTNYFEPENRFHGSTFLDLRTAFLPSALVEDKPTVDEGMYIRAATLGYRVEVGVPASELRHNSWPSETYGAAMMNFGPWSLPFFGLLLGGILGWSLKYLIASRGSDFALLLTTNIFLNFELSNLRIVNLVAFAVSTALFLAAFRVFSKRSKRRRGSRRVLAVR